jgi:hypothetical protein
MPLLLLLLHTPFHEVSIAHNTLEGVEQLDHHIGNAGGMWWQWQLARLGQTSRCLRDQSDARLSHGLNTQSTADLRQSDGSGRLAALWWRTCKTVEAMNELVRSLWSTSSSSSKSAV